MSNTEPAVWNEPIEPVWESIGTVAVYSGELQFGDPVLSDRDYQTGPSSDDAFKSRTYRLNIGSGDFPVHVRRCERTGRILEIRVICDSKKV